MTEASGNSLLELPKEELRDYLAALERAVAQNDDDAALGAQIDALAGGAERLAHFLGDGMALAFRPERALGAGGLVQLAIETGAGVVDVWLEADANGCRALATGSDPDAVIRLPVPVLLRIAFKQLTGPDAYIDGSVTAAGDVVLAAGFDEWFDSLTSVAEEALPCRAP